jgi:hypothetical protein
MDSFRPGNNPHSSGHVSHYLLVLLGTITVTILEVKVPVLTNGLRTAPFALISTIAALYCDYWAGIFAVFTCSMAVDYTMSPFELSLSGPTLFKVFEFIVISATIFTLSWRSRRLYASNVSLSTAIETLHRITEDLKVKARGDRKELKKLNMVNKQLVTLVDEFVKDDEYWARRLTTHVPPTEKIIKKSGSLARRFK